MTPGGVGIGEPDGGAGLWAAQVGVVGRLMPSSDETPRTTGRGAPRMVGGRVWRAVDRLAVMVVVSVVPPVRVVSAGRGWLKERTQARSNSSTVLNP